MISLVFGPIANALPRLMQPPSKELRKTGLLASAAGYAQKEECWKNFLARRVVTTIQLSSALLSEFFLSGLGVFEKSAEAAVDVLEGRLEQSAGCMKTALRYVAHMVVLALYGTPLAALCFFAPNRTIAPFSASLGTPKEDPPDGLKAPVRMEPSLRSAPAALQEAVRTLQEAVPRLNGPVAVFAPVAHAFSRLMQPPSAGLRKTRLLASAAGCAQKEECWKNFLSRHVVTTIQLSSALLSEFCLSGFGVFEKSAEAAVDVIEGRLDQSAVCMKTALRHVAHMVMLALYGTPLAALCFFVPDRMIAPFLPVATKASLQPDGPEEPVAMRPPVSSTPATLQEAIGKLHGPLDVFTSVAYAFQLLMQPPSEGLRKTKLLASAAQYVQLEECEESFFSLRIVTTILLSSALFSEFCLSGLSVFEKLAEVAIDALEGRRHQSADHMKVALRHIAHMVMLALYGTPLAALCFFAPDRMIAPFLSVDPKESPRPDSSEVPTPMQSSLRPIDKLHKRASELDKSLNEKGKAIDELRKRASELEKHISELRGALNKRDKAISELHDSHSSLERKVREMSKEIMSRKSVLYKDKVNDLLTRIEYLEGERRRLLWAGLNRMTERRGER